MNSLETTKATLRKLAAGQNADHAQYNGYWDGPEWEVVKVRTTIKTKLGTAFTQDQVALARTLRPSGLVTSNPAFANCVEVYSHTTRCNTVINAAKVIFLEA